MRILLNGAAGFLSSHLIPAMLGRGDQIIAQDILAANQATRIKDYLPRVEYRWKSVVDVTARDLSECDIVVHTAGLTDVPLSNTSPRYTYQLNMDALTSLAVAARETKTPILCMSTENVYGAVPPERLPAKEDEPYRPKNAYAASKAAMECLLHAYSFQFRVPVAVIRSSTLFGENMRTGQVVSIFTRQALLGQPITLEGDGSQTRDFNYVGNMVEAILKVTSRLYSEDELPKGQIFNVWNIGMGEEITLKDFVGLVLQATDSKSEIQYKPWRPGQEGRLCISIEKARQELGYDPHVSVADGLKLMADHMKAQLA